MDPRGLVARVGGAPAPLLAIALSAAALALFAALVPELPPLALLGGDAVHYAAMAEHPLDPVAPPPWGTRIGVPLVAAALPLELHSAFLVVAVVALLAAAGLVALIARELGVPPAGQVAAGFLTVGCYAGVHAVYNPYYVDPATLALVALALLLALRGRWLEFTVVLVVGVLVKEVLATLVVIPYVLGLRDGLGHRGAAVRTAAVAAPVVATFALVQLLLPVAEPPGEDARVAFWQDGILARGLLTSTVGPLVGLFGAALLLWPAGLLRGPARLRDLHVWALLALPILVYGHWERTFTVFLPLVLAAALWMLRLAPPATVALFAAGSFWVSGIASALTIGEGASSPTRKVALILPGLVLALVAVGLHVRRTGLPRVPERKVAGER